MKPENKSQRTLHRIITYGLALSFTVLIASLETLRGTPTGFKFVISWRTWVALAIGAAVMVPCFQILIYSERRGLRRAAFAMVVLIGVGGFFYPLRFVPSEKMSQIFGGLGLAVIALAVVAGLLLMARRFFEGEKRGPRD